MSIKIIHISTTDELFQDIRKVPLHDNPNIFVYKDSKLSIKEFYADELNLTKINFLRDNLERTKLLRNELLEQHGIDILRLDSKITYQDNNGREWVMIPPIVELSAKKIKYIPRNNGELDPLKEFDNIKIPVLGDGGHRGYLARELGIQMKVVYISNSNPNYPFYAYPNSWEESQLVDTVDAKNTRKYYVWEDKYKLYRDFGVISTGGIRKEGSKGY